MRIWLGTLVLALHFFIAYPAVKQATLPAPPDLTAIKGLIERSRQDVLKDPDAARKLAEQALVNSKKLIIN